MKNPFDISNFEKDGFKYVCDAEYDLLTGKWVYSNIQERLMFSKHYGWVYAIVVDDIIVKIGETGNPLGIRNTKKNSLNIVVESTRSRLGRLIYFPTGTDFVIRQALKNEKNIKIYAKKCIPAKTSTMIGGKRKQLRPRPNKEVELAYLDLFMELTGKRPRLNKARK